MPKLQKNFRLEETAIRGLNALVEMKGLNMTEVIELLVYREVTEQCADFHFDQTFYTEENGQVVNHEYLYKLLKAKEKYYEVLEHDNL